MARISETVHRTVVPPAHKHDLRIASWVWEIVWGWRLDGRYLHRLHLAWWDVDDSAHALHRAMTTEDLCGCCDPNSDSWPKRLGGCWSNGWNWKLGLAPLPQHRRFWWRSPSESAWRLRPRPCGSNAVLGTRCSGGEPTDGTRFVISAYSLMEGVYLPEDLGKLAIHLGYTDLAL